MDLSEQRAKVIIPFANRQPHYQVELTKRLAGPRRKFWIWGLAIVASTVIAATMPQLWRIFLITRLDTQLALAYTRARPFEFRLPDRGYAKIVQQRGQVVSQFAKSPPLLNAEATIAIHATDDPLWWERRGRSELLETNAELAVQSYRRAFELAPDDPEIASSLAVALALRGDTAGEKQSSDYAFALDLVSRVVRKQPANARVLYNRGLILERLQMKVEAIQQWRAYLALDGSSAWADEVRNRLEDLENQTGKREQLLQQIGESEDAFLGGSNGSEHPDLYLDRTAVAWLTKTSSGGKAAVSKLAAMILQRNGDSWLGDALVEARNRAGATDVLTLVDHNLHGDAEAVLAEAPEIIQTLNESRNWALAARARFEEVYALQRALRPVECLERAQALESALKGSLYRWLQIQAHLELTTCGQMLGHEGYLIPELQEMVDAAQRFHFQNLEMRAAGLLTDTRMTIGDPWAVWAVGLAGLREYWRSGAAPNRAHQFYLNMASAAENLDLRFAAYDFARAAMTQFSLVGNPPTEALGYARAAALATKADLNSDAAECFDRAEELMSALPQSGMLRHYEWDVELSRVQASIDRGDVDGARKRLPLLRDAPDVFSLSFKQAIVLGQIALLTNHHNEARQQLSQAVELAKSRLTSLKSPLERTRVIEESLVAVRLLTEQMLTDGADPKDALQVWLRFRSDDSNSYRLIDLPEGQAWLVYAVLNGRIAAWLLARNGVVHFHWLPASADEIKRDGRRLLELSSNPTSAATAIAGLAESLWTRLVGPFADQLRNANTLMLMDDHELSQVPFGLLAPKGEPPLLGRYAMIRAGNFPRNLRSESQVTPGDSVLVVAESHSTLYGLPLSPLPEAAEEGESVASNFHSANLILNSPSALTETRAKANRADIFHFAGHGLSNGENGSLVMGGSVLTADEIERMDWRRCRLAVLSACSTAIGESRGPFNANSLVRAFLVSGVNQVLASLWDVDSKASHDFMTAFYQALLNGDTPANALKDASQTLRNTPGFEHPYFWGAFQIYE